MYRFTWHRGSLSHTRHVTVVCVFHILSDLNTLNGERMLEVVYPTLHTYARYSFQKAEIEVKRNSTHLQNYRIVINLQMNPSKE